MNQSIYRKQSFMQYLLIACLISYSMNVLSAQTMLSNTCPSTTVDLTTALSSSNAPNGTTLSFHTSQPADDTNLVIDPTAVGTGTYYAAFLDSDLGCYSDNSSEITVTINSCDTEVCNICPSIAVDLTTAFSANNAPNGTILSFHTSQPAADTNLVVDPNAVTGGSYYVAFYDTTNLCYSENSTEITAVIKPCEAIEVCNICPSIAVDLTTAFSANNAPNGTILSFHTSQPAADTNLVVDPNAVTGGSYYVAFYDTTNLCYSENSTEITAVIKPCEAIEVCNVCPSTVVDLTTAFSASNAPNGTILSFHTSQPAADTNLVVDPNAVTGGSYYVAFYDTTNLCYSENLTEVIVVLKSCTTYDLALTKQLAPDQPSSVSPGDTVSYVIYVHNQGTEDASTVVVEDSIPSGMSLVPGGDFTAFAADSVSATIMNLEAGGVDSVSISLIIDGSFQDTSLTNYAEIVSDDGDDVDSTPNVDDGSDVDNDVNDGADDEDFETVVVEQVFDLALRKLVVGAIGGYSLEDTVDFEIVVYNQGTLDADSVVIQDYLPTDMTYVSSSTFDTVGRVAIDTIMSLAAGQTDTLMISLSIDLTFTGDSLVNNAEIIEASNALGQADQDSVLSATGMSDDKTELTSDNDVDDEAQGTQGAADNPLDADQYDLALVTLSQTYDLALTKHLAESGPFLPGDTVSYVIYVYNQGTEDATNIVVGDSLSAGMSLVTGGDFAEVGTDSVFATISSIASGEVDSVEIDLIIAPTFQGATISNTAEIVSDDGDDVDSEPDTGGPTGPNDDITLTDGTDDIDGEEITVVQEFDLALRKIVMNGSSGRSLGDTVDYQIEVYNQGTLDATEVVVKDFIPMGMTYVSSPSFDTVGNVALDTISSLAAGASDTLEISLSIDMSFQGDSLVNNAEIISAMNALGQADQDSTITEFGSAGDESELDTDNDINDDPDNPLDADQYDPALVTLSQTYDLALTKHLAESGPFSPGDTVSYVIYVYNQGTEDATNIVVGDSLSAGMSLVAGGDFAEVGTDSVFATISSIASGEVDSVEIDLVIAPTFQGATISNTAEIVSDDGDDIDSEPDTGGATGPNDDITLTDGTDDIDGEEITVVQEFDLALRKIVTNGSSGRSLGDTVDYQIEVYNQGTLDATEVVVKDFIPMGMTYVSSPSFDTVGNVALDTILSLAAGASDTLEISLSIDMSFQGDSLVNNAEIISAMNALGQADQDSTITEFGSAGDESELDTDNDINDDPDNPLDADQYDPALVTLSQTYDLALTKHLAESGPFLPGDTVSYVIYVYNQGTEDATNIVVGDSLSAGMSLVTGGDFAEVGTDSVFATISSIASGEVDSVEIDLIIAPTFQGATISNTAEIVSDDGDDVDSEPDTGGPTGPNDDITLTDGTDDIDGEEITVVQEFDLALRKIVTNGSSGRSLGDTVDYQIEVYNQGTLDATEVVVKDFIPMGMTYVSSASFDTIGGLALDTIMSLAAGQSDTLMISLSIDMSFQGDSLVNNAEIISAMNALGQADQDSTITEFGSAGDESELDTDNDINDDPDNPLDADQYDPALVTLSQTYDLALTKHLAESGPFSPGDTVSYVIYVYNQGTEDATNIVVGDSLSAGMSLVTGGDFAEVGTDSVFATISSIASGEVDSVEIDLVIAPTFQGATISNTAEIVSDDGDDVDSEPDTGGATGPNDDITLTDGTDDIDGEEITVVQEFDLALRKIVTNGSSGRSLGDTVDYQIEVYNQGTLDATEVVVKDFIPMGMTYVSSASFDTVGNVALDTISSLAAGASDTLEISLSIDMSFQGDSLVNNAEIISAMNALGQADQDSTITEFGSAGDESELDTDNDINDDPDNPLDADQYDPALVTLSQTYDLALTKHLAESGPFLPGDTVSYVIYVYNQGTEDATNIVVGDSLSAGMSLVTGGDFAEVGTDSVFATISSIASGEVDSVEIDLVIAPTFQGATISNTAEIVSDDGDDVDSEPDTGGPTGPNDDITLTDGTDDIDGEEITVVQEFDLALRKIVTNGSSGRSAGDTVDYQIEVYNQGTLDATEVVVKDFIPMGMTYVSSPSFDTVGNVALDTILSLAAGASDTLEISLSIDMSFQGDSLVNNAEIISAMNALGQADQDSTITEFGSAGDESELDTDNDINDDPDNPLDADQYDPALVTLSQTYDLALTKHLAESGPFSPGDTVSYVIYVYNQGTEDATNIVVGDSLSAGMSLVAGGDFSEVGTDSVFATISSIASGEVDSVEIDLVIAPTFQGATISNTAEIVSDDGDDVDSEPDTGGATGPNDDITLTDGTDDIDEEEITVVQEFDLALRKIVTNGSSGRSLGDTVDYQIEVYNQGTLDATEVVVKDFIPMGMTYVSSPSFDTVGNVALDTISSLAAGASDTLEISLSIDMSFQGDSLVNNAEIISAMNALGQADQDSTITEIGSAGDESELDTDNDINDDPDNPLDADQYDPALVTLSQTYDLALRKKLAPTQSANVVSGDTVDFAITIFNQGNIAADSLVIIDYVDTSMWKPFNISLNSGWTYISDDTARFTASIGLPLAIGDSITILNSLEVREDYTGILTNTAEIWADDGDDIDSETEDSEGDGDGDITLDDEINNTGSDEDDEDIANVIAEVYDLALIKTRPDTGAVSPGDVITFRIFIYNQGTIPATGVVIKDYVPNGLLLVDSDWNADSTFILSSTINPGGVDSVDIDLQVASGFQGTSIINNAEIISDNGDDIDSEPATEDGSMPDDIDDDVSETNGDDDYDFESVVIQQTYDLALIKELAPGQTTDVVPGDTVTFIVTVLNQGTLNADSIVLIDYVDTTEWMPFDPTINDGWIYVSDDTATIDISMINGYPSLINGASLVDTISLVVKAIDTLTNTAEILSDDGDDVDSQTEDIENDGDSDVTVDNEILNNGSDEDDEDIATVVSSVFDLALIKQLAPDQETVIQPLDTVDFIITITNQGSETAGFLEIVEYVDTSSFFPLNNGINTGWLRIDIATARFSIFNAALEPDSSLTIDFSLIVRPDFIGIATNTAEINVDSGNDFDSTTESDEGNRDADPTVDNEINDAGGDEDDEDIATVEVVPFDLALVKTVVDSGPFLPGDTVTFRVFVHNQGQILATDVTVEDYIPTGMTLADSDWNAFDNTYVFDTLEVGEVDSVDISLEILSSFMGTSLTNNAEIISAIGGTDFDSNPDNNEFTPPELSVDDKILDGDTNSPQDDDADEDDYDPAIITVTQAYDLALIKTVINGTSFEPGDTVDFRIYVFNQGTMPATSVTVKDYIPSGFDLVPSSWLPFDSTYTFANPIAPMTVDSVDLQLRINPSFSGDTLTNNAEILSSSGGTDEDSTPGNNQNDPPELAVDNKITDADDGSLQDNDPDEDDYDPAQVLITRYDLALRKTIPTGIEGPYGVFDTIPFEVTIFNQGNRPIGEFTVVDYIPSGMELSSADTTWTSVNDSLLSYTSTDVLLPGDSIKLSLAMELTPDTYTYGTSTYINVAEIAEMKDTLGNLVDDIDSTPDSIKDNDTGGIAQSATDNIISDNGIIDEDDSDPALVYSVELDPLGFIYCEKTGDIVSGGLVTVTGPGNVFFGQDSSGNVLNGSNGFYQFIVDAPGVYTISYNHPNGYPVSTTCLPIANPFDPAGLDGTGLDKDGVVNGELVLGSDTSEMVLIDPTCNYNTYFYSVTLDPSAPPIISNNNIPVQCVSIGSIVCDDVNANRINDLGLDTAYNGAQVYLYNCADTIAPIDSMTTEADGSFDFSNLSDGCYRVRFEVPDGRFISVNTNVDSISGWSSEINLNFGECDTTTTVCLALCDLTCNTITSDPTLCNSDDGEIVVTTSGGFGNYQYSLDDTVYQNSNIFTGLPAGSYIVYIRDESGCESQCNVTLNSPIGITCSLMSIDPTCSTDLGTLVVTGNSGSGNYEYSLNGGIFQTLDTFFNVTGGAHTVTIRDQSDTTCTSTCMATITIPTALSCSLNITDPTCSDGTGSIDVIASGGSSAYQYSLDGGTFQNNSLFLDVGSGVHTITVRDLIDSTCTTTCTDSLEAPPVLTCNAVPTDPTCSTGLGSVSVSGFGGNGSYEYSLNGGAFQSSGIFVDVPGGSHMVTVRDSLDNSCTSSCSVTITTPPAIGCSTSAINPSCSSGTGIIVGIGSGGSGNYEYSIDGVVFQPQDTFFGIAPGSYVVTVRDVLDNTCISFCNATISSAVPLTCSTTVTDPTCSSGTGTISITGMGGSNNYQYSINGGAFQTSNTFTDVGEGSYLITVRDIFDFSCTTSCTADVTAPPALTCNATPTFPTCSDELGVISISASGGSNFYQYRLDGGPLQLAALFSNVSGGLHTVTVVDAIDTTCFTTCDVTIIIPDTIGCNVTVVDPTCSNGLGSLTVTGTGGSGGYSYSLNGGTSQSSGSFINVAPGVQTITVLDASDNSCTNTCEATVTPPQPLSCTLTVTNPTCNNTLGTISVIGMGGSGTYEYSLDAGPFQSGSTFTDVPIGAHTVTVRDLLDINCPTSTCEGTIQAPVPLTCNAIATNPTCGDGTGSIEVVPAGGSGTYEYSLDGIIYNGQATFTDLMTGSYTLFVRDMMDNNCISTCMADIVVPDSLICSTMVVNPDCAGENGTISVNALGGSGSYEYSIDGGAFGDSNIFNDIVPGLHLITVRDSIANSCTSTCDAEIVAPAQVTCTITPEDPTCSVSTGSLTIHALGGSGSFEYSIDGVSFSSDSVFNGLSAGTYNVTVRDANANSCISMCSETISPFASLAFVVDVSDPECGDDLGEVLIQATGGSGAYEYSIDGINFGSDNVFTDLASGSYTFSVRDLNDLTCSTTRSATITVPPLLTCSAIGFDPECSDELGEIEVTVSNSNNPYTISWQQGTGPIQSDMSSNATYTLSDLSGGTWNITVMDNVDCETTCSEVITIPQPFTCSTSVVDPECYDDLGEILVEISGPNDTYNVIWQDQNGGPSFSQNGVTDRFNITDLPAGNWNIQVVNSSDCSTNCFASLVAPPELTCNVVNTTDLVCAGDNNGSVQLSASGANGGIQFTIDGIGSNSSGAFTNLAPGSYTASVSDISGCESECTFEINAPNPLTCGVAITQELVCNGGNNAEILVSASGGNGSYEYSLGGASNSTGIFTNLAAGVYTVSVSDDNDCESTCQIIIESPDDDLTCTIDISNGPSCKGIDDASIVVRGSGGASPYTYQINGITNTSGIFSNLSGGVFTAVITDDNGCASYCTVSIPEPTDFTCNLVLADSISCRDASDAMLVVDVTGGQGPFRYRRNGGSFQSSSVFANIPAGLSIVEVEDRNGCISRCQIIIQNPPEFFCLIGNVDQITCNGESDGSFEAKGCEGVEPYFYSLNGGAFSPENEFTNLPPGRHVVTVRDQRGCESECELLFLEPQEISCNVISVEQPGCTGNDGTIEVEASGGVGNLRYQLNSGPIQTEGVFDDLAPGSYTVSIHDDVGCIRQCTDITLNDESITCDVEVVERTMCVGDTGASISTNVTGGNPPYSYQLDNGAFTSSPLIEDVSVGIHTVTVRDGDGCETSCSIEIIETDMLECTIRGQENASCDNPLSGEAEIDASGGMQPYTYTLSTGESNSDGVFVELSSGNYDVVVTDVNGCTSQCAFTIELENTAPLPTVNCNSTFEFLGCNPSSIPTPTDYITDGTITATSGSVIDISSDVTIDGCIHTAVYEYRAVNDCGNPSAESCSFMVQWKVDTIPPVIPDIAEEVDMSCMPSEAQDLEAMDNCGDNIMGTPQDQVIADGDCPNEYTVRRTWTFIDDCGNTSSVSQIINIVDEEPPVLSSRPQDLQVSSMDNVPSVASITAIDNCNDEVDVQFTESTTDDMGCDGLMITRRWVATDLCGNSTSHTQSIQVVPQNEITCTATNLVNADCNENNGSVDLVLSGTGSGTYRININGVLVSPGTINGLQAGSYDLSVESDEGCVVSTCSFFIRCNLDSSLIDLELTKQVDKENAIPDELVTFMILVENTSSVDATGVSVVDYLPDGFYTPNNISNGGEIVGTTIMWEGLQIAGGAEVQLTFDARVSDPLTGMSFVNVAEILAADQLDVDSEVGNYNGNGNEDDEDFARVNVIVDNSEFVDLSLSKEVSDISPDIRDVIVYYITVRNDGTEPATGVQVTDYLPVNYCTDFNNISHNGVLSEGEIVWSDLEIDAGGSIQLSFEATVGSSAEGITVVNVAEITAHDQDDIDSTPDNGVSEEDDMDDVTFEVGNLSDLELNKRIINPDAQIGDIITFEISLVNNGPDPVAFVEIEDIVPDGFTDYANISHNGFTYTNVIRWSAENLNVGDTINYSFDARLVHFPDQECDYRNVAQVITSTSQDPDSTPDNDDGDQSEDDEDWAEWQTDDEDQCIIIETAVLLEGAFVRSTGTMHTKLNDLGYLPGQEPVTFFGTRTDAGQPYTIDPWNYLGSEGDELDSNLSGIGDFGGYPSNATDYVLVSLRTDISPDSTVCERVALVLSDGTLYFFEDDNCCTLDRSDTYYVVVQHRNHLPVMSHEKVPVTNGRIIYDFRAQDSYVNVLGFGQKEIDQGVWVMYAANGDQTVNNSSPEDINIRDLNVWLSNDGKNSGYFFRDYDLNGDVNVQDKALFLRNNGVFTDVRVD